MLSEFPTVAEMLALAVGAGEGPVSALERVTRTSKGELSKELGAGARTGDARAPHWSAPSRTLPHVRRSRRSLASSMALPLQSSVARPSPMFLRAQAVDVREASKRALLESGGKKEVAMMVPVVFFILPVTMLFALFPGFVSLRLLA